MPKNFLKNFVIFLSLIFVSCAQKSEDEMTIRIVDLQGRPQSVTTRVPELNAQALSKQGKLPRDSNYAEFSANTVQKTLQQGQVLTENRPTSNQQQVAQNSAANETKALATISAAEQKEQTVEYDLSEPEGSATEVEKISVTKTQRQNKKSAEVVVLKKSTAQKKSTTSAVGNKKYYAQVGSFASQESAEKKVAAMKKFHSGEVQAIEGDKTIYRALLGPFSSKAQARQFVKKVKNSGHDVVLIRGE